MTFEVRCKYEYFTARARRNDYELTFRIHHEFANGWWGLEYRTVDRTCQGYQWAPVQYC
jgi:hypothetical protein